MFSVFFERTYRKPREITWLTGMLMLFGNAGGVVVIIAMAVVKGDAPTFERAVYLLYGVVAVAIVSALAARETFGRGQSAQA